MVTVPPDQPNELEIGLNLEDNLPSEALSALTSYVLVSSSELALKRLDVLQLLLDEWDELDSSSDFADWADRRGAVPLSIGQGENGALDRSDIVSPNPVLPESMLEVLTRTIIDREGFERMRGIEGFRELLAEWTPYFDDEEKLLGHLLRAHSAGASAIRMSHDEMLRYHAKGHQAESDSE